MARYGAINSGSRQPPARSSFLPYFVAYLVLSVTVIIAVLEPWIVPPCETPEPAGIVFSNPEYRRGCFLERNPRLLFLTQREVKQARRIAIASLFGAIVG